MRDEEPNTLQRGRVILVAAALLVVAWSAMTTAQVNQDAAAQERGTTWSEFPNNPVYNPENGRAYYPTVIHDEGTYKMWFSGTSVGGFGVEMATSTDGLTWSEPTDASQGLAGFSHHAHVEKIDDHFRIWYWDCCSRADIGVLRTATSPDGVTWEDDQALQQVDGEIITGEPEALGTGSASASTT